MRHWLIGCVALSLVGCDAKSDPVDKSKQTDTATSISILSHKTFANELDAMNGLGASLLLEITSAEPNANVCISPVGLSLVLATFANGANGETLRELNQVMVGREMSDSDRNSLIRHIHTVHQSWDQRTKVSMSSSLWLRQSWQWNPEFVKSSESMLGIKANPLPESREQRERVLQDWVRETAGEDAPTFSVPLPEPTVMVALNILMFKGEWLLKFDKSDTKPHPFKQFDGTTVEVPMMARTKGFMAAEFDEVNVARIPIRSDFAMLIIVPRDGFTLQNVVKNLRESWPEWSRRTYDSDGTIQIPRFRLDSEVNLLPPLKKNGLERAVLPGKADFSRMVPDKDVWIGDIRQSIKFSVDEEGAEAVAVSRGAAKTKSASSLTNFIADRAFVFALVQPRSNCILMLGVYGKP